MHERKVYVQPSLSRIKVTPNEAILAICYYDHESMGPEGACHAAGQQDPLPLEISYS